MATRRVLAYFMNDQELAVARDLMSSVQETPSFLMGEVDETDVAVLAESGLIVQTLGAPTEPPTGVTLAEASFDIAPDVPEETDYYFVTLAGPLMEEWRAKLDAIGIVVMERVPQHPQQYRMLLAPEQVAKVRALSFVVSTNVTTQHEASPIAAAPAAFDADAEPEGLVRPVAMLAYDVRVHDAANLSQVETAIRDLGGAVGGAKRRKIRFYALSGSDVPARIAAMKTLVARVDPYVVPRLHNDRARLLLGVDRDASPAASLLPLTGAGQVVGIADTGIDEDHPDFKNAANDRFVGKVALGRPGDFSDPHGHGTHVAGSVASNGAASGGAIRGVAPEAKIFFQSLLDEKGELGGLPLDLNDLFQQAYDAGARIHNNSWGAATLSIYPVTSDEVDEFVANHRDMLIVISAGNEGVAFNAQNAPAGFVDRLSLCSPATAKNALTVGASRTDRVDGPGGKWTWKDFHAFKYPDVPIAGEQVSGDPAKLAAFSSRGPCDDRRIKPDVIAPGTDILSTRSKLAPDSNFWGSHPAHGGAYAFNGGTSMAAPLVSGCAALVRQYYIDTRNHVTPSAALLKATLINGTRQLTGDDAVEGHAFIPNHHQGFGAIHMPWTIPNDAEPFRLEFVDSWADAPQKLLLLTVGGHFRFRVQCHGGPRLRICLTWTDLPNRALQNNLNLFVQKGATKYQGNENAPFGLKMIDPDNNVEIVRIDDPAPGLYTIQVVASNLLQSGQDFALVLTGDIGPITLVSAQP